MLELKRWKRNSNAFSIYIISSLPAPKYFPNKDTHPHFTDEKAWCNTFMLKRSAKDPERAVGGAKGERWAPGSPANAKPGDQQVTQRVGACGSVRDPGTLTALKPKSALTLWLLDGSTAQLDVLPPCGTRHLGTTKLWCPRWVCNSSASSVSDSAPVQYPSLRGHSILLLAWDLSHDTHWLSLKRRRLVPLGRELRIYCFWQ